MLFGQAEGRKEGMVCFGNGTKKGGGKVWLDVCCRSWSRTGCGQIRGVANGEFLGCN